MTPLSLNVFIIFFIIGTSCFEIYFKNVILQYSIWFPYTEELVVKSQVTCAMECASRGTCRVYSFELHTCYILDVKQSAELNTVEIQSFYKHTDLQGIICTDIGYTYFNKGGFCLKEYNDIGRNWDTAQNRCIEDGGNLIQLKNREDKYSALQMLSQSGKYYWVGGRNNGNSWTWIDGSNIPLNKNWETGQPNGNDEDCIVMYVTGKYHDGICSNNDPYCICERRPLVFRN